MTYSLNNVNKCDVTAIEIIYKGVQNESIN